VKDQTTLGMSRSLPSVIVARTASVPESFADIHCSVGKNSLLLRVGNSTANTLGCRVFSQRPSPRNPLFSLKFPVFPGKQGSRGGETSSHQTACTATTNPYELVPRSTGYNVAENDGDDLQGRDLGSSPLGCRERTSSNAGHSAAMGHFRTHTTPRDARA